MKPKPITDLVSGNILQRLSPGDAERIMEAWEAVYCPVSKSEKKAIGLDQYRWHTFSFGIYPSVEKEAAIAEYLQQSARSYYVVPEARFHSGEAFETDQLPSEDLAGLFYDIYVFPRNLAWTFAFTHEHGWIGPFFAKHPDYDKLNKKNLQSMAAHERGWS